MNKKSMSVPEMRRMLGLGKTESYWVVKKNYFETITVAGKMRIMVDSFEKWYAKQLHYKKVDGSPPGEYWTAISMSVRETADLICITESSLYDLLKKKPFRTTQVGMYKRIYKDSFEDWYNSQTHYKKVSVHKEVSD